MHNPIAITPRQFDGQTVPTVNARELWQYVESRQDFSDWIKNRIAKYEFAENVDYLLHKFVEQVVHSDEVNHKFMENPPSRGGRPTIDYHLTLDMAKELAMVENNPKGREVRRYFIDCERQAKAAHEQQRMAGTAGRGRIPAHEADRIVAASRTFNALLRSAQAAKVPLPTALRQAAEVAQRETGIDLIAELRMQDHVAGLEARHQAKHPSPSDAHYNEPRNSAEHFWLLWSRGELNLPYQSCTSAQAYHAYRAWCAQSDARWMAHEQFTMSLLRFSLQRGEPLRIKQFRLSQQMVARVWMMGEDPMEYPGQWAAAQVKDFAEYLKAFERSVVH